jgi:hypothetical protein
MHCAVPSGLAVVAAQPTPAFEVASVSAYNRSVRLTSHSK